MIRRLTVKGVLTVICFLMYLDRGMSVLRAWQSARYLARLVMIESGRSL